MNESTRPGWLFDKGKVNKGMSESKLVDHQTSEMSEPTRLPSVQGRCPACHMTTLFLGQGGYVTCGWAECRNPTAADDLLHQAEGYIVIGRDENGEWPERIGTVDRDEIGVSILDALASLSEPEEDRLAEQLDRP